MSKGTWKLDKKERAAERMRPEDMPTGLQHMQLHLLFYQVLYVHR